VAALLAAFGLVGLVQRRRVLLVLGAALAAAVLVVALVDHLRAPSDAGSGLARLEAIPSTVPPRASTLCGVDCLHVALAFLGPPPDYARLVKLVRPGSQGTTLETLRIVAECMGFRPSVVDPRGFAAPPDPMIAHVPPSHFVVVTAIGDGRVALVDPARGLSAGSWEDVRRLLSPVGLALGAGGGA
jgi:hypothetical protein